MFRHGIAAKAPYGASLYGAHSEASILFGGLFGDYFNSLGDDLSSPPARIALAWQKGSKWRHEYFADTFLAGCRADDLREEKVNSFFSVSPRNRETRKEFAIPRLLTLHLDVDRYSNSVEQKIRREQPSALVWSGRGLHAYWFLDTPVPIKQKLLIRSLNRELVKQFDGDFDSTDVGHILRVPGTFNVKNPGDPKLVKLMDYHPDRRYPLDDLADRFRVKIEPTPRSGNGGAHSGRFLGPDDRAYVKRLIAEGLFEQSSRNHSTLLLARYCLEEEMTQDAAKEFIIGFFENNHNGLSKDWLMNRKGCIRQIESAVDGAWAKSEEWKQAYYGRCVTASRKLSGADLKYIGSLDLSERARSFVIDALTFILNHQRDGVIVLATRDLYGFSYTHSRNYKERLAFLESLGIISLIEKGKPQADPKKRKASAYQVIYQFQEGAEGIETEDGTVGERVDKLILSGATNDEIRGRVPEATRQLLHYRRRRFDHLIEVDRYRDELPQAA